MREPNDLISTDALARDLSRGDLRVFDCTTYLEPPPPGSDEPYIAVPGRSSFETAHIPGADFLDLQGEFSDNTTRLRFMLPPVPRPIISHNLGATCWQPQVKALTMMVNSIYNGWRMEDVWLDR
jgi:hypothetical protein